MESLVNSELLDEVEPELSDLSENAVQNVLTLKQQRWRAKRADQTEISKEFPLVHMAELAFRDAKIPLQW